MRVLMTVGKLGDYGGVEQVTTEVGRGLVGRGHHVDLLYRECGPGDVPAQLTLTQVPDFDLRLADPLQGLRRIAPAVRATLRLRPDVAYVGRFDELPFALASGLLTRLPVVCHLHYFSEHRMLGLKGSRVRRFVAVSRATADEWVRAGLDGRRIDVVPNGIDVADYPLTEEADRAVARKELGIDDDMFVVLYCGRVSPEKGLDVLVDAWARLALPPRAARLLVVGGVDPRREQPSAYQRSMMARGVPGIEWIPARSDVLGPMRAADVLAVPSWNESFGRVIIEAMATGLPVVASRVGGIPETLGGLEDFLVQPGDPVALGARLLEARRWGAGRGDLRRHVADTFSIRDTVTAIERVLAGAAR